MAVTHLLLVVIAAIGLTIFAERRNVQAPLLLAAVGLVASMIPGVPGITLSPDLILSLVLPPLLYSAALEFSFFSFMKRIGSILNLGVLLVLATTVAGGAVVGMMLPGMSLPLAFVLAAAVAPPDAVSAVAIGRKLGLPNSVMTVLKGESLINDAAALTLFSAAAAAATGGHTLIGNGALYFLYTAMVGMVVGIVLARLVHAIRRRLQSPSLVTALAIVTPFAAYALAEEAHASGVIAVVFAGFTLGHNAAAMSFAGRIQEREVWRVVDALLEAFVFVYMGLQFRFIVADAARSGYGMASLAMAAGALFATVVLVRIVWVFGTAGLGRLCRRLRSTGVSRRKPVEPLGWRENLVLSWAGMRGVVTLAAAAGMPLLTVDGDPLAGRAAMLPIAFVVAMATLLLHGLTLPWLIRRLGVESTADTEQRQAELQVAYAVMAKAGDTALDELKAKHWRRSDLSIARLMLKRMRRIARDDGQPAETKPASDRSSAETFLAADAVLTAQRQALIVERNAERLDDELVRELLAWIDVEQAALFAHSERSAVEPGDLVGADRTHPAP